MVDFTSAYSVGSDQEFLLSFLPSFKVYLFSLFSATDYRQIDPTNLAVKTIKMRGFFRFCFLLD